MEVQIKDNILAFKIDTDAGLIEKTVSSKSSSSLNSPKKISQGTMYIHNKYIGRNCLFILTEKRSDSDVEKQFLFNGESFTYYDMLLREVKSAFVNKKGSVTGKAYFPYEWIGKKVVGIILSE